MHFIIEYKDSYDWLDAATTFASVILGALLAYTATRVSERHKERAQRIAGATLLVLKVRTVIDGIFKIDRQLREGMARAASAGVTDPLWAMFEEIAAMGDYEEVITVEDMAVLAEHEMYDLIQEITELKDAHNSIVRGLVQLFRMKSELATAMPPNHVQGNVAVFMGTPSAQAQMLIANLDMLSNDTVRSIDEAKGKARTLSTELHRSLKEALRVVKFPQIALPDTTP